MRYDFAYVQALQSRARRERAEAVHRLIIAPLVSLFRKSKHGEPVPGRYAPQG